MHNIAVDELFIIIIITESNKLQPIYNKTLALNEL